jgi:predicted DNA-binding protein (MmcQ/YjbR family)
MTIDFIRQVCRALPAVTEDIKWGNDLCFLVAGRMFVVVNLVPPNSISFKCTPESFGELIERPGIRPAPYMARNMWVQEEQLGEVLDRAELEPLVRMSYQLVVAKMPKSRRPGAKPIKAGSQGERAAAHPAGAGSRSGRVKTQAPEPGSTRRTARRRR